VSQLFVYTGIYLDTVCCRRFLSSLFPPLNLSLVSSSTPHELANAANSSLEKPTLLHCCRKVVWSFHTDRQPTNVYRERSRQLNGRCCVRALVDATFTIALQFIYLFIYGTCTKATRKESLPSPARWGIRWWLDRSTAVFDKHLVDL